jgi:hypothetical protein
MNNNNKKKSGKVLGSYQKVGTKFVPPLLQKLKFDYTSWTSLTMPELVWWDVLVDKGSHRFAASAAEEIAKYFRDKGAQDHWWAFVSDYSHLFDEDASALTAHLSEINILPRMIGSLSDFLYLYPDCPISKLFGPPPTSLIDPNYLLRFEARLEELEDKRSRIGVLVQAQAIYMAFISDRLHVRADLALADFPEVENYPSTEKSIEVGASVCAAVNMLASELPKYPDDSWVQYFWKRSLELRPLDFLHLERK